MYLQPSVNMHGWSRSSLAVLGVLALSCMACTPVLQQAGVGSPKSSAASSLLGRSGAAARSLRAGSGVAAELPGEVPLVLHLVSELDPDEPYGASRALLQQVRAARGAAAGKPPTALAALQA